jgi:cobyrinic acid a,c-diamide synthase
MEVRSAKSGPDYIDPRFHEFASGNTSLNLDTWAMTKDRLKDLSCGKGTYIVEGAMGLFDGDSSGLSGSTALLAKILNLNVVLVIDCSKMAQSVAALVRGFITHDTELNFLGIILNKLGSEKHEKMIRNSLSDPFFPPVIGALKRDSRFHQPSRHLGLVQATERDDLEQWLDNMADEIERNINLDTLKLKNNLSPNVRKHNLPPGQNISIARDKAFSFIYPHLEQDWKKAGANLRYFSPLANEPVPDSDFIYLPGGYPELYAGIIAKNDIFLNSMRNASKKSLIFSNLRSNKLLN